MIKILMPMLDGGIIEYQDDTEYCPGCETCDYGSEYINKITITMTHFKIRVVINNMYNHAISESDIMKTLLPAYEEIRKITEAQFATWFHERLIELMKENDRFVDVETVLREYDVQQMDGGATDDSDA